MNELVRNKSQRRFVFISTCPEAWGGSEELWSGAAVSFAEKRHSVSVFKTVVDKAHPTVQRLKSLSCKVRDLQRIRVAQRFVDLLLPARYQLTPIRKQLLLLGCYLVARRPDLAIISQGDNYDGIHLGYLCRRLKQPYVIISQKATDHFWPRDEAREKMRQVFESARECFFVSNHNRRLTEDQIGMELANAAIVRNPFLVAHGHPLTWPDQAQGFRLACVGRLFLLDKGQDILLRVLARRKWQCRNLSVSFFGQGVNREGLDDLARKLGVSNVTFAGQTRDVPGIWKDHHALIMPSRCEGLPLSLVESMLSGRLAIATNVGGNGEIIEDNINGFLAAAATEADIDEALERAWERRGEWREIGQLAATRIRELVPANPASEFADRLMEIASKLSGPLSLTPFGWGRERESTDELERAAKLTALD